MNLTREKIFWSALLILVSTACASGTVIVTGTTRPAVAPETVRLYADPPADYEVIGLVSASSDAGWTEQGDVNHAIAELKRQAAKLGANGVLITSTGDRASAVLVPQANGSVVSVPVTAKTIQGRAIFVKAP